MEVVDFIAEFSASRELSLRLLEPSLRKVIYAREAGVDWRQLVASQLHEIGHTAVPKVPDSRTYDLECLRQVVEDYPDNVADQETAFRALTRRSEGDLFPVEESDWTTSAPHKRRWESVESRMYPTPTHMSEHFQKRRVEMHLSLTQLAKIVGYTNVSKGYRKIDDFERTGRCHPELFAKLSAALGIDERTRNRLAYEDYKDWLCTPANPPTPYLLRSRAPGLPRACPRS